MLRGTWSARFSGPFRPKYPILGSDTAGRIEAVGSNVTHFQPGDAVWGDLSCPLSYGAFAEYVCIPEPALRRKLDMLSAIGADHVIDYTRADFTRSGQRQPNNEADLAILADLFEASKVTPVIDRLYRALLPLVK